MHIPAMCESAIYPANPLELLRNSGMAPLSRPSVHAYFGRAARRPCNNLTGPATLACFLLTRARVPLFLKGKY